MTNFKQIKINQSSRRVEKSENAKGKEGIIMCENCHSVYCRKSWKKNILGCGNIKEDNSVQFSLCPACKMIKNNQFEGEIKIFGLPENFKNDFLGLVKNSVAQAEDKDPMDRLIKIEEFANNEFRITMTENQSTVRLAKKIKQTFDPQKMQISHSPSPNETVYIRIRF